MRRNTIRGNAGTPVGPFVVMRRKKATETKTEFLKIQELTMLRKLGGAILWLIAIFMLSSVTVFNPGQVTDFFIRVFNIKPSVPQVREEKPSHRDERIQDFADQISEASLQETVSALAGMGSRVPGYPGHRKALEYVKDRFEALGLEDITVEEHNVTVPIDKGATLDVLETGDTIRLYGLWPNHVQTPSLPDGGVTGALIDAGDGSFRALNSKPVANSIALMKFDCGQNYLNPRMLGAQAIIFYDNGGVSRGQAQEKLLQVPVDVPRFWVEKADAARLAALAESNATLVRMTSQNGLGEGPHVEHIRHPAWLRRLCHGA